VAQILGAPRPVHIPTALDEAIRAKFPVRLPAENMGAIE